ncbi:MAG: hypothetical protein A2X46_06470 [Lentisphaerae bacterium GWF2_57_35]|nr:MAG: hypothetical protein A2X46_06470 [Lentisphaerae bacterium GWF2_57_35]
MNHTLEASHLPDWRHAQIDKVASNLVGLDYEKEAVQALQAEGWDIVCADAQDFNIRDRYPDGFDVVIASEVIEHLVNPGGFLCSIRKHLAPGGKVLITTPHAYGFGFSLEVLIWGSEHMNDDHTATYSQKNMECLLRKCGFRVAEFHWLIQDSSQMVMHSSLSSKIVAKLFFWVQCMAAGLVRSQFSKEMIVVAQSV